MVLKYIYDTHKRRNSIIKNNEGETFSVNGVPPVGYTADTRFFGKGKERKFVVKRPKYYDKYERFSDSKIKKINSIFQAEYKREQEVWNLVYPDNKAELFTEGGLRLVLPCLPGVTLRESLGEDDYRLDSLALCQKLLAAAYAVREFHQLGWNYTDFNADNILLEKKLNGTFKAYLIDLNGVSKINDFRSNQELFLLGNIRGRIYSNLDACISDLSDEISKLKQQRADEEKIVKSFKQQPEKTCTDLTKQFIKFLEPEAYIWPVEREKKNIYTKLYEQEGLENVLVREQFCLFLKDKARLTYERLAQSLTEDKPLLSAKASP